MVPFQLQEKVQVVENPSRKLNATAVQQVADILEEAEKVEEAQGPKTDYWYYSVPSAGVRYYSF